MVEPSLSSPLQEWIHHKTNGRKGLEKGIGWGLLWGPPAPALALRRWRGALLLLLPGSCDPADPGGGAWARGQEGSCQFSHGTRLGQGN